MAHHKYEAVLVTRRRKFRQPQLEIEGHLAPLRYSIKYLGVLLDRKWFFQDHVREAVAKVMRTSTALEQLMPNIGGPNPGRRMLLASVVHSILLYGAHTWSGLASANVVDKYMGAV